MGSNGRTFRRRFLMGSRVAILGVSVAAILATTACGATDEKLNEGTRLAPPAVLSAEHFKEFQRATDGNYWCGVNYNDRTVAVSSANTSGEAYGMKLKLAESGKELAVTVSYDIDVFVKAFIVGDTDTNQQFLVPVPPDRRLDTKFVFAAEDFLGATTLNWVSACPRHTGE